jgi:hypothetical protein
VHPIDADQQNVLDLAGALSERGSPVGVLSDSGAHGTDRCERKHNKSFFHCYLEGRSRDDMDGCANRMLGIVELFVKPEGWCYGT